jgi:hypothetical protein
MTRKDPYRAPAATAPAPVERRLEADGLDDQAFARRAAKREAVERAAAVRRGEDAGRQTRLRAGAALVLGTLSLFTTGPYSGARAGAHVALSGGALVGLTSFLVVVGTGGASSMEEAPSWVKLGMAGSALAGLALGWFLLG